VLPERFQHLVPRRVGGTGLGDQHGLRHQTREPVDDVPARSSRASMTAARRNRAEGPREHARRSNTRRSTGSATRMTTRPRVACGGARPWRGGHRSKPKALVEQAGDLGGCHGDEARGC
jgi:hypothetical protein